MRTRKKVIIGLGIIMLTAGLYGYLEYNRSNTDLFHIKADFTTSVSTLIQEFESDEKAANEKFLDKIISVQGVIKEVIRDSIGNYTIVLKNGNNSSSVRCSMDNAHPIEVTQSDKGKIIAIKGACTGFNADELLGSDVFLNRCVIQNPS